MGAELYPTIRAWLIRARNDLAVAEFTAEHRNDLLDTAVYHCQQAAEKSVKAFLINAEMELVKTHDVSRLVSLAAGSHVGFTSYCADANFLAPLATEFRYPMDDEAPMPSIAQADEALAAARRIYSFVLSLLPPETHPA